MWVKNITVTNSTGYMSYYSNTSSVGSVKFESIDFGYSVGAGVLIKRDSAITSASFIIDNIWAHGATDVTYVAKMLIHGSGSITNGSGIYNIIAEDLTVIGNDGLVVLGGSGIVDRPLVAQNINIRRVLCGASCDYDAVRVHMPYAMLNVAVVESTAYNLLHLDITGNHYAVCVVCDGDHI